MPSFDELRAERILKLQTLEGLGLAGYTPAYPEAEPIATVKTEAPVYEYPALQAGEGSAQTVVAGRLMTYREHGKLCFGQIQADGERLQVAFLRGHTRIADYDPAEDAEYSHERVYRKLLDLGDYIGLRGDVFDTQKGERTLLIRELTVLSKSLRPLPDKFHGLTDTEAIYRQRYLDTVMNSETHTRLRQRMDAVQAMRQWFYSHDFREVETRTLTPQAGGAMAETFSTHHNALDIDLHLRIALELDHKMVMAGDYPRIFEVGKCFRNEGIDPSHLQEFTMVEWYAAYATLQQNQDWMTDLLRKMCEAIHGSQQFTLVQGDGSEHDVDLSQPFATARFPDLLTQYAGIDMQTVTDEQVREKASSLGIAVESKGRSTLLDDIYKKTARHHLVQPTFVYAYPSDLIPLANPNADGTADMYQLVIGGWECMKAFSELVDPRVQRELLERQAEFKAAGDAEAMEVDEEFLAAMEHGMPPMTGFGMGIDRIVAILTGQTNLKDVVHIPLMRPKNTAATETDD